MKLSAGHGNIISAFNKKTIPRKCRVAVINESDSFISLVSVAEMRHGAGRGTGDRIGRTDAPDRGHRGTVHGKVLSRWIWMFWSGLETIATELKSIEPD